MGTANALKTHCKNGHEFTPENTRIVKGHFRHCRTCQRLFARKRARAGKLSRGQVERLLEALQDGKSLQHVTGFKGNNGHKQYVPGQAIARRVEIKAFMANNPLIGRRMQKLIDANGRATMLRAAETRRIGVARVLHRADAFDLVTQACASISSETIREEVRSAMWLAMAEGRLKASDVRSRVQEFVRQHNRMFTHFVPHVGGFMGSLDMRLADGDNRTLHDQITRGLWE